VPDSAYIIPPLAITITTLFCVFLRVATASSWVTSSSDVSLTCREAKRLNVKSFPTLKIEGETEGLLIPAHHPSPRRTRLPEAILSTTFVCVPQQFTNLYT